MIRAHYAALRHAYGAQHWWPGRSRFEVILGAFLTQNTAWSNVKLALRSLRRSGALSVRGIRKTPEAQLAQLIRSSGFFRQKARSLKSFVDFLDRKYGGSLNRMFSGPSMEHGLELRTELLNLRGVGRETADSILLYAGNFPVFVVDAYARRVFTRHQLLPAQATYEEMRNLVESALRGELAIPIEDKRLGNRPSPASKAQRSIYAQHLNEFHALLVQVGKRHCHKSVPDCEHCPLKKFLPRGLGVPENQGNELAETHPRLR